jgi:hypothetical protein
MLGRPEWTLSFLKKSQIHVYLGCLAIYWALAEPRSSLINQNVNLK